MLKSILSICLIFNLYGCKIPQFKPEIRRTWSFTFESCFCHWYDLNKFEKIDDLVRCETFFEENFKKCTKKRIKKKKWCYDANRPNFMYCDDLIGFSKEDMAIRIKPKQKEIYQFLIDYNLTKKEKKNFTETN